MSDFSDAVLTEALRLASLGYRVHPVHGIDDVGYCTCGRKAACKTPGKHPLYPGFLELATTDIDVIKSWPWGNGYNLGIVPGDDITILDFDGEKGFATFKALIDWRPELGTGNYGLLQTGSGGYHLIGRGKSSSSVRRLPGMDVRGTGGQAVVAPSKHYSGNYYQAIRPLESMVDPFPPAVLAIANGEPAPPELEIPVVLTIDDLRPLARKQSKYQSAWRAVVKGEPYAQPGERDDITTGLIGAIAKKWPNASAVQVAKLFRPSLEVMASEAGAPTVDDIVEKFERFRVVEKENANNVPDNKSAILITTNIVDMSIAAIDALSKFGNRALFRRAGKLSYVVYNQVLPGLSTREEETPTICPATQSVVRGQLSAASPWVRKNNEGNFVAKLPPNEVCAYVTDIGEWPKIPYLEGITSGPVLRLDGSVFRGDGYDESTGLYSVGQRVEWPYVPTQEALEMLCSVFSDFPFKTGHYSVVLAALLTGVGRYAFRGPSPLFLIDANTRGAGKTLCASVIAKILSVGGATGAGLGTDNEEDRKQITSLAMGGAEIILVDNVTGKFGTPKLCEALTLHNGTWSDRVLGKNETWTGPFRPLWLATGNNVTVRADMARRICYCRLESPLEKPEERVGFSIPSLMGYVAENREKLYWCALSILKAYWDDGRPKNNNIKPWGGYEEWSDLIRGAVTWCGYSDPGDVRKELIFSDDDHDYGTILVEGVGMLIAEHGGPMKCSEMIEMVYGFGMTKADAERYQDFREVIEALTPLRSGHPTPQSMGKVLQRYRGRVFGGKTLQPCGVNNREWRVIRKEA